MEVWAFFRACPRLEFQLFSDISQRRLSHYDLCVSFVKGMSRNNPGIKGIGLDIVKN